MQLLNVRGRTLAAVAAALACSFAVPQVGAGPMTCSPDVYVKNRKAASIKVLKFEYTVKGKSAKTESLVNKRLAPGEEERWPTQNLSKADDGDVITSTRVQYKNDNSGAGDGYGPAKWSKDHPHSDGYYCMDGRNYAHYIDLDDD